MRKAPSNLRSLETRLRNLARVEGIAEGRLRRVLNVVVVGHLLERGQLGAIKGATNLEIRLGTLATRVSGDLDAVRSEGLKQFRDRLNVELNGGWQGFSGRMIDRGEIPAPLPQSYRRHRFEIKLEYADRPFGSVELEVAHDEIEGLAGATRVELDSQIRRWFAELGLRAPDHLPALPLPHQIAQKIHACTAPDTEGWVNGRAHDLVDLQLAVDAFDGSIGSLRSVATRLFRARAGHGWPPVVTVRGEWAERYASACQDLEVVADIDAAVDWANELIERIDRA